MLIVGPVPPPAFGVAKATRLMIDSPVLAERLRIVHMDTSDPRGVGNIGKFDYWNAWLAIRHVARHAALLLRERPGVTLLTASQGTLGLLRDCLLASLSHLFHSRTVIYMRGSGYADLRATRGWLAARILRYVVTRSALVMVLSENLVAMAKSVDPRAKVVVVPNGSPRAVSAESAGARKNGNPVVTYIGRLGRSKGTEEAIDAACILAASFPGLEVVLAGGWDSPAYESWVRARVVEGGLTGVVHFPGPVGEAEKAGLLARAWVLIVPSHSEGQPWVILEAMSAGVPVVASDTGAIGETIEDGVAGFVVPVGDSERLAERISQLLRDQALRNRMSDEALRRYEEHFTVERSHTLLAGELCRVAQGE